MRLAIISNAATPYRIHLHRRIVRELPQIELWTVFTHQFSNAPWRLSPDDSIRPVYFGPGEHTNRQGVTHRPMTEWRKGGRIIRWIRETGIEAIVLFGYNDLGRLRLIRWCHGHNIPCYLFGDSNIRNDQPKLWQRWIKRRVLPLILSRCAGVFHCGDLGAQYFKRYGVTPQKLYPFPYEPDYELLSSARLESEPTAKRRCLLYSGRLTGVKRVDLLLDAFERIADQRPEWDLVIAGDGDLRAALTKRAGCALRSRIHFTGFLADSRSLAGLYSTCDVLVLPSDREPWGVVVTEAATCLALVCSSAVGAAADLIKDHKNGRIFESGNCASLVEALLEVTANENLDRMKAASPVILAEWRRRTDPVQTLRKIFLREAPAAAA